MVLKPSQCRTIITKIQTVSITYLTTIVNTVFINVQIKGSMPTVIGNNYYQNTTVDENMQIFYFFAEDTNVTITNETLIGNTLDDLYNIGAVNYMTVENFTIISNTNTAAITETSAIFKVSMSNGEVSINNF